MTYIETNLEWLNRAQEIAHMGIWDQDPMANTLWWSDETYRIFGLKPQSQIMNFEVFLKMVHPDYREAIREKTRLALISDDNPYKADYQISLPDGQARFLYEEAMIKRNVHGKPIRILGIIRDITSRRVAEEKTRASLKEKETLLREIHHRVKNNMAVIGSLLMLQSDNSKDHHVKEALKESQNRVYAMSAVHEALYKSESITDIDLKCYLSKISEILIRAYSVNPGKVTLKIEGEDVNIDIKKASPLGLVINELISNSLKYAFPDQRKGEITMTVKKHLNFLDLCVADNGIGMSEGDEWQHSESLGINLVTTLIEDQLDGSIRILNQNGAKFFISFEI